MIFGHPRCYDCEEVIVHLMHDLPLNERKVNAKDQAAPLAAWDQPAECMILRRLAVAPMIKAERRKYAEVQFPIISGRAIHAIAAAILVD